MRPGASAQRTGALRQAGEVLADGVLPPGNEEVFKSDLGAKGEGRLIDRIEARQADETE